MNQKIHFITYGDGRAEYFEASIRLSNQAKKTGWFDTITVWNSLLLNAIEPEWYERHQNYLIDDSRGHGYWIWKSRIILTMLQGMNEGDILVYLDAGCEINLLGVDRFKSYIDLVNQFGFLFFYLKGENFQIGQWTKARLLKRFGVYEGAEYILSLPQMESGVLFFKNTNATRCLVKEWADLSIEDNYSLINDTKTNDNELISFKENRHDQAILSLLFIKHEYGIALQNDNFFWEMWKEFLQPEFSAICAFRNLRSRSFIDQVKLVPGDRSSRFLWVRNSEPIFADIQNLESYSPSYFNMANAELKNYQGRPVDLIKNQNIFDVLRQKLTDLCDAIYERRVDLLLKLYEKRDQKISEQTKMIEMKERVISSQVATIEERFNALAEKEAVINAQTIKLDQRLLEINEGILEINKLRKKVHYFEHELNLQRLSIFQRCIYQLRHYKSQYKAKLWIGIERSKKYSNDSLQKFLHQLRVIKHASKYLPNHPREFSKKLKDSILDWCRRKGGIELGYLETYPPRKMRLPIYYGLKKDLNNPPKISLVTPSYQQAQFIERTIKSVLSQNYPNLEYVIQDGNSSDGTQKILKKYANKITSYESIKDHGQSHAINLAFNKCSGEILGWLNSDDILLPGALIYIGDFFNRHPEVDVVYGNRVVINEDDLEIARWILPKHNDQVLPWADYIPQETLFWRRDIWNRAGSKIDEKFQFAMDWDLILRFRSLGANMVRLPRLIGGFRVHSNQKTNKNIEIAGTEEMNFLRERELGYVPDRLEVMKRCRPYITDHQLENFKWKILERVKLI
jgi:glycosyltransferase involved in cell wall biosynthesis